MDGVFKSTLSIIFGLVMLGMLLVGLPLLTFHITKYIYKTDVPDEIPYDQSEADENQVLIDSINTINQKLERTRQLLQKQDEQSSKLKTFLKGKDQLLLAQKQQNRQLKQKVVNLEKDTALLQQKNSTLQDSASIFKTQLIQANQELEQLRPKAALTIKAQRKAQIYGLLLLILIVTNILLLTIYRHFLNSFLSNGKVEHSIEGKMEQRENIPSL